MLAGDGDDYRQLPLSLRKTNLARLLRLRSEDIFIAPFELSEIGPDLFRHACEFGLKGLVSKRRDRPLSRRPEQALGEGEEPAHPAYRPGRKFCARADSHTLVSGSTRASWCGCSVRLRGAVLGGLSPDSSSLCWAGVAESVPGRR
jgi:hypothetical protein